jgi:NAD(P)-dependent dehydrogenase (short-subunit alcohol dehydrogenase family)
MSPMHQFDLAGRRAVITGGAQGIGRAIAERMLRSGASVWLWDQDAASGAEAARALAGLGRVTPVTVDVSQPGAVADAAAHTLAHAGGVDILVANAGIAGPNHPTWEYPVDTWSQILAVNLTGAFLCCRALVPAMIRQNYGRIVTIASVAGKEGNPNASAYSASKAGVIALTKSLGKEVAPYDIAVNCVTPAAAETRIFEQMSPEHIAFMRSRIPRGRFVQVDEIASLVTWLASAENSFSTGAVFDISGGRSTY